MSHRLAIAAFLLPFAGLALRPAHPQSGLDQVADADPHRALDEARVEERSILDQLQDLDRQLASVREEADGLQERIRELEALRQRHHDEAAGAEAVTERQRDAVATRVDALYRLHRKGLARVVFGAEDPADLRRRSTYLEAIIRADLERLDEFARASAKKREVVAAIEQDMQALGALRAELQLKEADLRDRRFQRVELLNEVRGRRELALRALSEMTGARQELGERLTAWSGTVVDTRRTEGAYDLSTGGPVDSAGRFVDAHGKLPWPTTGQVLHGFGNYTDARTGQRVESKGLDIEADYGTPVRAVFPGVVALAEYVRGYGQTVAVEHDGGYTTIYAHLNGIRVRKGERVDAADVLGLVGNTGLTDGSGYMLTFEVRYNRTAQDPSRWLGAR